jgi:hypothetical protein
MFDDLIGGVRKHAASLAEGLPGRRRKRPNVAAVAAPAVAIAGAALVAGLLLWDDRRRAAMRQRLASMADSLGSAVSGGADRVTPMNPVGAGQD